jgi:hypothetical protein
VDKNEYTTRKISVVNGLLRGENKNKMPYHNTFAKICIYRFGPNAPEMNRDKRFLALF